MTLTNGQTLQEPSLRKHIKRLQTESSWHRLAKSGDKPTPEPDGGHGKVQSCRNKSGMNRNSGKPFTTFRGHHDELWQGETLTMMDHGSTMTHGPDHSPDKRRNVTFPNANARAVTTEEGGWLATGCLFKNSGAATKSRMVSTTNGNSMRSIIIKTALWWPGALQRDIFMGLTYLLRTQVCPLWALSCLSHSYFFSGLLAVIPYR